MTTFKGRPMFTKLIKGLLKRLSMRKRLSRQKRNNKIAIKKGINNV